MTRLLQHAALSLLVAIGTLIPSLSQATSFTYTALLGPDPGQEQFVDAITSDLTMALSRIGHSLVI